MTTVLRISLLAPIALVALMVFTAALLLEWLGDLTRACPHSEDSK
jgi:hypothetical protein